MVSHAISAGHVADIQAAYAILSTLRRGGHGWHGLSLLGILQAQGGDNRGGQEPSHTPSRPQR
eukprot:143401-Karenia_brevis.AAC.1